MPPSFYVIIISSMVWEGFEPSCCEAVYTKYTMYTKFHHQTKIVTLLTGGVSALTWGKLDYPLNRLA